MEEDEKKKLVEEKKKVLERLEKLKELFVPENLINYNGPRELRLAAIAFRDFVDMVGNAYDAIMNDSFTEAKTFFFAKLLQHNQAIEDELQLCVQDWKTRYRLEDAVAEGKKLFDQDSRGEDITEIVMNLDALKKAKDSDNPEGEVLIWQYVGLVTNKVFLMLMPKLGIEKKDLSPENERLLDSILRKIEGQFPLLVREVVETHARKVLWHKGEDIPESVSSLLNERVIKVEAGRIEGDFNVIISKFPGESGEQFDLRVEDLEKNLREQVDVFENVGEKELLIEGYKIAVKVKSEYRKSFQAINAPHR